MIKTSFTVSIRKLAATADTGKNENHSNSDWFLNSLCLLVPDMTKAHVLENPATLSFQTTLFLSFAHHRMDGGGKTHKLWYL